MIEKEKIHVDVNGVWFNGKHSWRDFGLFLADRPDTGTPAPKTVLVDVPGSNGSLDYTEAATGYVTYENRIMTFHFSAMVAAEEQQKFISRFRNAIHGRNVEVELDEDAGWIYNGRAEVAVESAEDWKLKLTVTVNAYPYKLSKSFRTIRLNLPGLTTPWGEGRACELELRPEQSMFGSYKTFFRLTRSYAPDRTPYYTGVLDLTKFGGLGLQWDEQKVPYETAAIVLEDAEGNVARHEISTVEYPSGLIVGLPLFFSTELLEEASLLTIEGISNCRAFLTEWTWINQQTQTEITTVGKHAKTVIDVGDMPVFPVVHQVSEQGFELWCNGSRTQTVVDDGTSAHGLDPVPYPPTPNLVLMPGKNEVVVAWRVPAHEYTGEGGKFCDLSFREGRL